MSAASGSSGGAATSAAGAGAATAATLYQSRSCLTAESAQLKCNINKLIAIYTKLKGKMGLGGIINNIAESEIDLDISDVKAFAWWLSNIISKDDSSCKDGAPGLLKIIRSAEAKLRTIALHNQEGSDAVAEFLTESLRVVNFATHDAGNIKYFYNVIKSCGINFESDADFIKCLAVQSFAALGYMIELRKIRATMT